MILPLVPQDAFGVEGGLLTALAIGFVFGFALERAGFGNARKLAAQFYLYDMTVFKVMFTAIITAMTGLYALAAWGWVDLSLVWINPTFLGPQLVGGFLLGAGFIVSGLCPGTGFVSLASGKVDAVFALLGVMLGTLLFGVALEAVPAFQSFYAGPSSGTLLLHELMGIPAPWLALGVVLMALGCFIGAEKLEAIFEKKLDADPDSGRERSRVADRRGKFVLAGSLAAVCVVAGISGGPGTPAAVQAAAPRVLEPLELAEALVRREPDWLLLDLRPDAASAAVKLPGAVAVDGVEPPAILAEIPEGFTVVLIGAAGQEATVPAGWPVDRDYRWLAQGADGWEQGVLTPATAQGAGLDERAQVARQNQLAAYFSGADVAAAAAAPPPPPAAAGGVKKKKKAGGGC